MNFTERYGFVEKKSLQVTSIDNDLRHSLWNVLDISFSKIDSLSEKYRKPTFNLEALLNFYWIYFFRKPLYLLDKIQSISDLKGKIRSKYYKLSWYETYSFLEVAAAWLFLFPREKKSFIRSCNFILERENSAYRFVNKLIAPITSEIEINCIEKSLVDKDEAAKHINSALTMLANKQNDQFRESIEQSILAVEAIAKKITGDKNATLASLCHTAKILPSNSQARQALFNLYNYTSSKEGIRHTLTNESQPVTPEWARFMLVISSAFVNLIKLEIESSKSA
jgi:AbiJ N-terminal domain 4